MPRRIKLFDLWVDDFASLEDAADYIYKEAKLKPVHVVNMNMDQLVQVEDDSKHKELLANSELIIADGVSISLLVHLFCRKSIKKIAGIELAAELINRSKRLALLGASEEILTQVRNKFASKIVFAHNGYFSEEFKEKIIDEIIDNGPDLILVALGIPLQEAFIEQIKSRTGSCVLMGVGGSFDIWAGKLKRAPKWMIFFGLEWLFRLIQEPSRLKRFFNKVRKFMLLLISQQTM